MFFCSLQPFFHVVHLDNSGAFFENSYTTCIFNFVSHKQFFYLEHLFFHMVVVVMIWKSQDGHIVCVYGCMNEVWSSILQLFSMLINLQTQQQVLKKIKMAIYKVKYIQEFFSEFLPVYWATGGWETSWLLLHTGKRMTGPGNTSLLA